MNTNQSNSITAEAMSNSLQSTKGQEGIFVMIPVSISVPSPARTVGTLKQITAAGDDVTGNKNVRNSTIQMFDPKEIAFGHRMRDEIKAIFRASGFNLGHGLFLISESKVEEVYNKIIEVRAEYSHLAKDFLARYDDLVLLEQRMNPRLQAEIQKYAPSLQSMEKSFRFKVGVPQAVQVHRSLKSVEKLLADNGMSNDISAGMTDPIVDSFAADMRHFWRYNLRNARKAIEEPGYGQDFANPLKKRIGIKAVFINILKNMKLKITEACNLDPRFSKVADEIDNVLQFLPDGVTYSDDENCKNLELAVKANELALRMLEPSYIHALLSSDAESHTNAKAEAEEMELLAKAFADNDSKSDVETPVIEAPVVETAKVNTETEVKPVSQNFFDIFASLEEKETPVVEVQPETIDEVSASPVDTNVSTQATDQIIEPVSTEVIDNEITTVASTNEDEVMVKLESQEQPFEESKAQVLESSHVQSSVETPKQDDVSVTQQNAAKEDDEVIEPEIQSYQSMKGFSISDIFDQL